MNNEHFNSRSDVLIQPDEPGMGDNVPCEKCGVVALDTGLECDECGHDNWESVTGRKRQKWRGEQQLLNLNK